jgi:hypothetical protein
MYIETVIKSENDAVHFRATLRNDGTYVDPNLSFYWITKDWRTLDDPIADVWDNSKYLIDDLYLQVVRACKLGLTPGEVDSELELTLQKSRISIEELKDLMTRGIEMGFFANVECDFFS